MNISYQYIEPDMIFTDNREEVIDRIQIGEWDCILCPQMFGYESGCIERSGRKAFNNEPFNPDDLPEGIPASLLPQTVQ